MKFVDAHRGKEQFKQSRRNPCKSLEQGCTMPTERWKRDAKVACKAAE